MMGRATARLAGSSDDEAFVQIAARGDMLEMASARFILEHSRNDSVRAAARQMMADHTTLSHKLRSALSSSETADFALPSEMPMRSRRGDEGVIQQERVAAGHR